MLKTHFRLPNPPEVVKKRNGSVSASIPGKANLPQSLRVTERTEKKRSQPFSVASGSLRLKLFRLQLREQDHVADAFLAEQHHAQAVNADAAGRRHAVFQRDEKT